MGKTVYVQIGSVRIRQQWLFALRLFTWGVLLGSLVGIGVAFVKLFVMPALSSTLGS